MKYVMINHRNPIIFPEGIPHIAFRKVVEISGGEITSAGFVNIKDKKILIYGQSSSLGIFPKETDQIAMEVFLAGYTELDLINIISVLTLGKGIPP